VCARARARVCVSVCVCGWVGGGGLQTRLALSYQPLPCPAQPCFAASSCICHQTKARGQGGDRRGFCKTPPNRNCYRATPRAWTRFQRGSEWRGWVSGKCALDGCRKMPKQATAEAQARANLGNMGRAPCRKGPFGGAGTDAPARFFLSPGWHPTLPIKATWNPNPTPKHQTPNPKCPGRILALRPVSAA
jgi:hypothetical protein